MQKDFQVLTSPSMSQAFCIFVLIFFVSTVDQTTTTTTTKDMQLGISKGEWKQLSAHNAVATLMSMCLSLPGLQTRAMLMCS